MATCKYTKDPRSHKNYKLSRLFDGKLYYLMKEELTKKEAESYSRFVKRAGVRGTRTRIVMATKGYNVYGRGGK